MGRTNTIDTVLSFIFKYVWLICAVVIGMEFLFVLYSASQTVKSVGGDVAISTRRELEHKIKMTWNLADALVQDSFITDTSQPLHDRVARLRPYSQIYELFLIGITNREGTISSTLRVGYGEIGHRDYFKRVISSGKAELTDVFPAGADGKTMNYTICVPFRDDEGRVSGTLIMSIPFSGIVEIINRVLPSSGVFFSLVGGNNTIMARWDNHYVGDDVSVLLQNYSWTSADPELLASQIKDRKPVSYWAWYKDRLLYVNSAAVNPGPWKLLTAVDVLHSVRPLLYAFMLKAALFLLLFGSISWFGKTYTEKKLKDLNTLVRQVVDLQNKLQSKKLLGSSEIGELVEMSQRGLIDDLTGLPTRTVFLRQLQASMELSDINQLAALLVIDLDDLKQINDSHGHEAGDMALKTIGMALQTLEQHFGALVSRFGGDEFLVYLPVPDISSLPTRLERINELLRNDFVCNNVRLSTHGSIGAALYPDDGDDFPTLYRKADMALYQSKKAGKNRYHIWDAAQS